MYGRCLDCDHEGDVRAGFCGGCGADAIELLATPPPRQRPGWREVHRRERGRGVVALVERLLRGR